MLEVLIGIQIIGLVGLGVYIWKINNKLHDQIDENNNEIKEGIVYAIEKIAETTAGGSSNTYKDAKHMMDLRLEEFKFAMLSKAGEFLSNKFLKVPVGLHQMIQPDSESGKDINKPDSPPEIHG